jgi:hypothetical protein
LIFSAPPPTRNSPSKVRTVSTTSARQHHVNPSAPRHPVSTTSARQHHVSPSAPCAHAPVSV